MDWAALGERNAAQRTPTRLEGISLNSFINVGPGCRPESLHCMCYLDEDAQYPLLLVSAVLKGAARRGSCDGLGDIGRGEPEEEVSQDLPNSGLGISGVDLGPLFGRLSCVEEFLSSHDTDSAWICTVTST